VGIEPHTESLKLKGTQGVLVGDFDVGVFDALQSEFLGNRSEVFLLLGLICHHGSLFIGPIKIKLNYYEI
jgi:hypothetical protein